ncbi:GlxA family transcriptional regulator [Saccharospirillum salsuginis]|uniref:AraC family transcriptional regulator n=1 Tax=Saccharospirillum salsuginis TaxID=418750 RepID=A0A918KP85_9GAMM|nr:helix-turn-helix domain-containing protein [Saccharospirillum salsuginis]GGX68228.1 AraC family transcriptional regulator [Saccharospirillum salsuginis]
MTDRTRPIEVALLATPESTGSTLYGMVDVLSSVGRDWPLLTTGQAGESIIRPLILSRDLEPLPIANGGLVQPQQRLAEDYQPDVVCVLELFFDPFRGPQTDYSPEVEWLKGYWQRGGIIAAACTGAYLLGQGGLLDDQDATTHWAYCDLMARSFPSARVHPNRVLVTAGLGQRLIMAGGGTSWMDMALYLIARFFGVEEATRVAKVNLIDWHENGQQPYAMLSQTRQVEDARIAETQTWVAQHYNQRSPVATMVTMSGLSERSFKRRFKLATGLSPMEYVLTLRLEEAKHILETSDVAIDVVAEEVGYQDAAFFSRKFQQKVGITPAQYRRKFGGLRRLAGAST